MSGEFIMGLGDCQFVNIEEGWFSRWQSMPIPIGVTLYGWGNDESRITTMRYLIGIDDTDSRDRPGTAVLARRLVEWLRNDHMAEGNGITRHQLAMKKHIPYTAHNSAVCILIDSDHNEGVWETTRDFLALESDPKSNTGFGMSRWEGISHDVIDWGHRAKKEVLTLEDAQGIAAKAHVRTTAVRGTGAGVIGALAAIGLHREGNDGRFLWLPGLPELQGKYSVGEIFERTAIDRVCTLDGVPLPIHDLVEIGDWTRPVLRNGQATLYVEEKKHGWAVLGKERVKELSS